MRYTRETRNSPAHHLRPRWLDYILCTWYTAAVVLLYLFFYFTFFPSHLLSSPFCSLPPSRNSDPGSHSRLFSPPTHYGSCLAFLSREDFSSLFPRRLASNCAYQRQALSAIDPFFFFLLQIKSKSRHGGIRTHGPTLVAFEGYH